MCHESCDLRHTHWRSNPMDSLRLTSKYTWTGLRAARGFRPASSPPTRDVHARAWEGEFKGRPLKPVKCLRSRIWRTRLFSRENEQQNGGVYPSCLQRATDSQKWLCLELRSWLPPLPQTPCPSAPPPLSSFLFPAFLLFLLPSQSPVQRNGRCLELFLARQDSGATESRRKKHEGRDGSDPAGTGFPNLSHF